MVLNVSVYVARREERNRRRETEGKKEMRGGGKKVFSTSVYKELCSLDQVLSSEHLNLDFTIGAIFNHLQQKETHHVDDGNLLEKEREIKALHEPCERNHACFRKLTLCH